VGKSYRRGRFGSSNFGVRPSAKPVFRFLESARLKLRERAEAEIVAGVGKVERRSGYLSTEKLL